jgi:hypothetical protein
VVKPEIGASRRQFIHRCQTFTGASAANADILGESYDIRSQVEHLHDWQNGLPNVPPEFREERLKSQQRRSEALGRHVYGRVCTSQAHRQLFEDGAIDGFWARPDDEKRQLWGAQLDLPSIK